MMTFNYKIIGLFIGLIALTSCSQSNNNDKHSKKQRKPNVVFILADDFGAHDMSVTGSKFYETPNIDKISNDGMTFTNGYAACQVCSPSRASIMSGKSPARIGITDWIGAPTGENWRAYRRYSKLLPPDIGDHLPLEYTTLPEAMKEIGYKTFFAGKWHIGDKGSWPTDHGFDINKGGWDVGSPDGGYFSPWVNPNLTNKKKGENLSMRLADETVNFIKENRDTTFFAFLSFYAVHAPIQTSEQKWRKYRDKADKMGIKDSGYEMERIMPIRTVQDNPIYAGLVESMDDAVGEVLKSLKDLGLEENTIVIFTSDNGGVASGDAFATSNLPLRGGKGYQFEGGIREPFFIKVPWLKGGRKFDTPAIGTDLYPTILDLVGAKLRPQDHNDGVSLLPVLEGKGITKRPLIWHYPHYGNQGGEPSSIIRLGDWKLIHYYEDGREELYNLKDDISEQNDVASKNKEIVADLHKQLFDYLNSVGAKFPVKDPEYDAAKEKKWLEYQVKKKLPSLEKQRKQVLSEDFAPNKDWWGSKVTVD